MEREADAGGPIVCGFSDGRFRIGDRVLPAAWLTTAATGAWSPPPIDALTIADLQPLVDAAPEFILLGTGARLRRPDPALVAAVEATGIGIEPMDSRAAARAWGVLRGEGRTIAAALYPIDYAG